MNLTPFLLSLTCAVVANACLAQTVPQNAPSLKCAGAPTSAAFHACLAATATAKGKSWRAAHPTVAAPKPPELRGPGYGVPPRQIVPSISK
jgi:hypothetical protein